MVETDQNYTKFISNPAIIPIQKNQSSSPIITMFVHEKYRIVSWGPIWNIRNPFIPHIIRCIHVVRLLWLCQGAEHIVSLIQIPQSKTFQATRGIISKDC